ncbi:MAG TPA: hypothetical protein PL045_01045 [Chitinophagaceae bacterium]|nr:hypothetical protein [Chitinophagaceae bacterium]
MGIVYANIELIDATDFNLAKWNQLDKDEVKRMQVDMLVNSGAYMLCINENIQAQLQLPFVEKRKAVLANGSIEEYDVVGPVIVKFKNRTATCNAFVLRADAKPLLGVIPMEEMDVLIHPQRQELIVNPGHPYFAQIKMK